MAFANYADLKASVATWLARDDLTAQIPDFISLHEAWLNTELRTREMEQRAQTTTTTEVYYGWPADMLEIRYIKVAGSPPSMLTYLPPEQIEALPTEQDAVPRFWSDIQSQLRLAPTPASGQTIEIGYYKKLDLASDTNNWLLNKNPGVYLFGTLMQAEPFLMNDQRTQTWNSMLTRAINGIEGAEWRVKAGATPRTVRSEYAGA